MFVCYYRYSYFIDISHGSVETHLQCGMIYNNYNNHIIANCLQSVPVKRILKIGH